VPPNSGSNTLSPTLIDNGKNLPSRVRCPCPMLVSFSYCKLLIPTAITVPSFNLFALTLSGNKIPEAVFVIGAAFSTSTRSNMGAMRRTRFAYDAISHKNCEINCVHYTQNITLIMECYIPFLCVCVCMAKQLLWIGVATGPLLF